MTENVSNRTFGWFETADEIITTAEGHTFTCRHVPTNRTYLLRVSTGEVKDGWRTPHNSALELPTVHATVAATAKLYSSSPPDRDFVPEPGGLILPEYHGVLDARYLVPVSAVYRRRGAIPFENLLSIPSALVHIFPFWENLWLLLTSETSLLATSAIPFDVWEDRWQHLVRGSELGRQLFREMPAGLSGRVATRIASIVNSQELGVGPSLEESSIIRLMIATAGKQVTKKQVEASLACPFFRMNTTVHDLHYAVALAALLQPQEWLFQSPLEWLGPTALIIPTIIDGLLAQPSAFPDDSSAFERCPPPDEATLTRFSLFLREPELTVRPYLTLQET
ncbi:hypothetical protein [Frankia sp. Cj3]|uniref:hypothetical protein n=1 Tax=Frankia sp. Cj3 TaxID=2880976 RepID=UPI001EF4C2B6|nr:hypothetical protein [Frankia sp. Cj3]